MSLTTKYINDKLSSLYIRKPNIFKDDKLEIESIIKDSTEIKKYIGNHFDDWNLLKNIAIHRTRLRLLEKIYIKEIVAIIGEYMLNYVHEAYTNEYFKNGKRDKPICGYFNLDKENFTTPGVVNENISLGYYDYIHGYTEYECLAVENACDDSEESDDRFRRYGYRRYAEYDCEYC